MALQSKRGGVVGGLALGHVVVEVHDRLVAKGAEDVDGSAKKTGSQTSDR